MRVLDKFNTEVGDEDILKYRTNTALPGFPATDLELNTYDRQCEFPKKVIIDTRASEFVGTLFRNRITGIVGVATEGSDLSFKQVQGVRYKGSYRVATCLRWQALVADRVEEHLIRFPELGILRITMPCLSDITNIEFSGSSDFTVPYSIVRSTLRMRWSDEEKIFIKDLKLLS